MTTFAVTMVKDELDVIEHTVLLMAGQVDHVIVSDNGSTDGTRDVLADLATWPEITVLDDPDPAYYQSRKMTALAARAATSGADWVIPFDADERWYSPFGRIADVLAAQDAAIATAMLYDHVPTASDPDEENHVRRIGWRRHEPTPLRKVACRATVPVTIEQGNHGAGYAAPIVDGLLVVRHFPLRSAEQMIRKARNGGAAYEATNLPEHVGQHWRDWNRLTDEQIDVDVFRRFYWSPAPEEDPSLTFDPCPLSSPGDQPAPTADALGAT